jgi:hypothetical protein
MLVKKNIPQRIGSSGMTEEDRRRTEGEPKDDSMIVPLKIPRNRQNAPKATKSPALQYKPKYGTV